MWLYLSEENRPPAAHAQRTIAALMRETYLLFARWTALISIVMWMIALLISAVETLSLRGRQRPVRLIVWAAIIRPPRPAT